MLEGIKRGRQLARGHFRGQAACLRAFKGTGKLLVAIYGDRQLARGHLRGQAACFRPFKGTGSMLEGI